MIRRWGVPVAILTFGLVAATWFGIGPAKRTGFPAPNFALPDLAGRVHRLSDTHGKVVFLNVWATWCPPCRMEMPSMEQLYRRLKGQDFVMLAVSEDAEGSDPVRAMVEEAGLTFPVLLDPQGEVSPRYGVTGYPETFIIDRQGMVVEHIVGPEDWSTARSYRYFADLLQRDPGPQPARANGPPAGN
jgi:cytochrome c biogenesis protein CcmG/thiol:disulfide interchange protein DsbE